MPVTLRSLLNHRDFGLTLGAQDADGTRPDASVLEREIAWVHSSDLADPTPWLEAGQLLLTDGSQFGPDGVDAAEYVARLVDAGIVGLGFAMGVVHDEVPEALARATQDAGLVLLLVPASMPFIRLIRHVADVTAADRSARITWSIQAQRSLARAALQPDGLSATLRELEVQLGSWVALFDQLGRAVSVRTKFTPPAETLDELRDDVALILRRGRRAATRLTSEDRDVTLQTIGQQDRLRGVLAVGTSTPLDHAGTDLVASFIGIASIVIEQSRELDHARRELRRGVLELYLAGSVDAAGRALRELRSWVPESAVRVAVITGISDWDATLDELELRAQGESFTFARRDDELVLMWAEHAQVAPGAQGAQAPKEVEDAAGHHPAAVAGALAAASDRNWRVGISAEVPLGEVVEGLRQARRALARTQPGGVTEFARLAEQGMLAWLEAADGALPAARILAPLLERQDAELLARSASVWFAHNCVWDAAARELGVHRHTLRARVDLIGEVCGVDLGDFGARAELWTALQLARP